MFEGVYNAVLAHKDGIGLLLSFFGVCGIGLAAFQLRETQRQRGISESLQLFEKLDSGLAEWSACASASELDHRRLSICFGRIIGVYEIVADGLNRGHFSRMAAQMLSAHLLDGLPILLRHGDSAVSLNAISQDDDVYKAMKIFLLRQGCALAASDAEVVMPLFFGERWSDLFERGPEGFLRRRMTAWDLRLPF